MIAFSPVLRPADHALFLFRQPVVRLLDKICFSLYRFHVDLSRL